MKQSTMWNKLIWAVDPFSNAIELQSSALLSIKLLTRNKNLPIEPVYILNESYLSAPENIISEIDSETLDKAQSSFNKVVGNSGLDGLLPLKIISRPFLNKKEIAEVLINYAKNENSDLIILSTHAKTGMSRWFTGSFAENLMLYSDIPLFIANPYWKSLARFKHILFPTDFSKESFIAYKKVINLALYLQADITIFHQFPFMINPHLQASSFSYSDFHKDFEIEIAESHKNLANLSSLAEQNEIQTHSYIDYKLQGSVAVSILNFAKKNHYIIALTSKSSGFIANVLGSTTRTITRRSTFPVWLIHPHDVVNKHNQVRKAA